jgi:hypothetical protein
MTTLIQLKNGCFIDSQTLKTLYIKLKKLEKEDKRAFYHLAERCTGAFDQIKSADFISSRRELIVKGFMDSKDHISHDMCHVVISATLPVIISITEQTFMTQLCITNPVASNSWEWLSAS